MDKWMLYLLCAGFLGGACLIATLYVRLFQGKRNVLSVCSVALDEVGVEGRIKRVMKYKKPGFWIVIACVLLAILVAVLFLTVPARDEAASSEEESFDSSDESPEESSGDVSDEESGENSSDEELSFTVKIVSEEEATQHAVYKATTNPDAKVYYAIIPSRPLTMVMTEVFTAGEVYVRDIRSYKHNTIEWVVKDPGDFEFREIAAGEPIYVYTDQPSAEQTWGISWTDEEERRRYIAVLPKEDGTPEAVEMTYSKDCKAYLPPIEIDYAAMEVIRTITDQFLVLEDPDVSSELRHVLVRKSSGGVYTEICRAPDLSDKLIEISEGDEWAVIVDPHQKPLKEATIYYIRERQSAAIDLSQLPDDETISYLKWISDRQFLFVSRRDDGKTRGGELWSFAFNTEEIRKIFSVADDRLQITEFDIQTIEDVQSYFHVRAVYRNKDDTSFEEKTFTFVYSGVSNMSSYRYCYILTPEDKPYIRPSTDAERNNTFENATPGAFLTNKYAIIPHEDVSDLILCTFTATGESGENGTLYACKKTRSLGQKNRYAPLYVQGSAKTSDAETWGIFAGGRYYAMLEDPTSGFVAFTDITDRIAEPELPADLSTLFDDTAREYDDYRRMNLWNKTILHIYKWDQYFAVDRSANGFYTSDQYYHNDYAAFASVSGDTALFFSTVRAGSKWGVPTQNVVIYRFEKGKSTPAVTVIEAPPLLRVTYRYSAVTEDIGYLFVFEQEYFSPGQDTEYLALLLKTADGGKTWEKVPLDDTIASGNNLKTPRLAKFLTEDIGVLAFAGNALSTLPDQVHYTLDGGKTWQTMSSLGNLPFQHISMVSLYDIALEDGVYTITLHEEFINVTVYQFRSTDLKNWELVE